MDPYVRVVCENTKGLDCVPDEGFAQQIDVTVGVALVIEWAARKKAKNTAVRVLQQLISGEVGSAKDWEKTRTMAEKAYSPESTNARLLSNFYLPDPPPLLTLKQQWKCDATVASLDAFAFIEPIHTDTALGMAIMEPCATATDTDTDTDNVDLGQCDMVGPVDLRDTFSTDTWFMETTDDTATGNTTICNVTTLPTVPSFDMLPIGQHVLVLAPGKPRCQARAKTVPNFHLEICPKSRYISGRILEVRQPLQQSNVGSDVNTWREKHLLSSFGRLFRPFTRRPIRSFGSTEFRNNFISKNLQLEFTEYFFMLMEPFLKDIGVCR